MVVMVSKVKAAPKPAATSEVSQLLTCIIVINFLSFGMEGGQWGRGWRGCNFVHTGILQPATVHCRYIAKSQSVYLVLFRAEF